MLYKFQSQYIQRTRPNTISVIIPDQLFFDIQIVFQ